MKQFHIHHNRRRLLMTMLATMLFPGLCAAQSQGQSTAGNQNSSVYDKVWKFAELYSNDRNPIVQSLRFTGRFHGDYALLDADEGSHSEWNVRRLRLGTEARVFRTIKLKGEVELNPQEGDPLYSRITDLYVRWEKSARFGLTVGKQSAPFTMDGATSSTELLAIDRSNLSNNVWFPQEYIPGVSISGQPGRWVYRAGMYSAGEANREFGKFNGSVFTLAVVGFDFGKSLGVNQALLAGDYVYQNPDENNTFTRQLQHVASVNFKFDAGRWGARTEVSAAWGYLGQSDLWGAMAMPFVNATGKLQFVARYTFMNGRDANSILLATYEKAVVSGKGDRYNEVYIGGNYYFYGHKLKIQSGVQFADMSDRANDGGAYSGVAWTSAIRVSW